MSRSSMTSESEPQQSRCSQARNAVPRTIFFGLDFEIDLLQGYAQSPDAMGSAHRSPMAGGITASPSRLADSRDQQMGILADSTLLLCMFEAANSDMPQELTTVLSTATKKSATKRS